MSVLERNTGRAGPGRGDAPANGGVEALHADGIGEVVLHRAVNAGKSVVEAGEPAVVLRHQFVEELSALIGRGAGEFGPSCCGALAARDDGLAAADLEHAAEEIQHVREDLEARERDRVAHGVGGLGVQFGEAEV